jgi:hypothetical protein
MPPCYDEHGMALSTQFDELCVFTGTVPTHVFVASMEYWNWFWLPKVKIPCGLSGCSLNFPLTSEA